MVITEDFNKRIMNPELSNVELVSLHKEAMELYEMYFKSNAVHKVNVKEELVNEIVSSKRRLAPYTWLRYMHFVPFA